MREQQPQSATISVDAGREIWRIPKGLRGFNFWGTRSDAAFFPEYQAIGLDLLRFPPGRTGDENELSQQLIDESGIVAKGTSAELVVEVRLRGGTPERAAANVGYMNQQRRYAARYWEIGNEPDIYGRRAGEPDFSPAWYAERFREYAQAMKRVDPSIKIFGPVLSNKLNDWMPPFISACGDIIDGLSWHFYGGNGRTSEADLLGSTATFDQQVAQVRRWWSDSQINPLGRDRTIPLLISEYGASYETNNSRNLTTLPAALWTADMLGHLISNKIDLAAYFTLWGLNFHGVWDRRGGIRPVHHTFRMFSSFGSHVIQAASDQSLLPVYAALRDDGTLSLMLINKDPAITYRAALDLQNFQISGPPQLLRQASGIDGIPVAYNGPGDHVMLDLPPYSTTLVLIPGQPSNNMAYALGLGGLVGAAALAGAAALIRRKRRAARMANES